MWDGRVVVVEVRSGRKGYRCDEKEYYYLSGKVDFGIVREGDRRQGRVE